MTLQQLEYITALDKYRHFVKAAEACGITQSTLSAMIQKLELELDTIIFDRMSHPVKPTLLGEEILRQAQVILYNTSQLKESVALERHKEHGEIKTAFIPTVAPYILPKLFRIIRTKYPQITLKVSEMRTALILESLHRAEIDVAILATPIEGHDFLEIPVYYERFMAYVSPKEDIWKQKQLSTNKIPMDHMWVLHEGHCLRNQVLKLCHSNSGYSAVYEAGSIDTLVRIVDENGGYTIIPELHFSMLSDEQKLNIRGLTNPEPLREISMLVRKDFVKERFLNILAQSIREILPDRMVNERLKKFVIKI